MFSQRSTLHGLLLCIVFSIVAFAGDGRWTGHGPFMAAFNLLEISPSNANWLYAANGRRILRSTDSGLTWLSLECPSYSCPGILRLHPRNTQIAYAVDYSNTISVTNDGGRTWRIIADRAFSGIVGDLEVDWRNPSVLYVAKRGWTDKEYAPAELLRSTDAGVTWKPLFSSTCCLDDFSGQIELDPVRENRLYAAFDNWFFRSTDSGKTWTQGKIGNQYIGRLKVDPFSGDLLYSGTRNGIWRSTDGGGSWLRTRNNCIGDIDIDSKNPSTIYTTGKRSVSFDSCTMKSTDRGQTWSDFRIPRASNIWDVNLIRVSPRESGIVFASSDLLYRTRDGGGTWRIIIDGKGGDGPWRLAQASSELYTYSDNRLFRSHSGGGEWNLLNTPREFTFWDVRIHPTSPGIVVAAGGITPVGAKAEESFLISNNGGKSWNIRRTPFRYTAQVLIDPADARHFLVSADCPSIYRNCLGETTDSGQTWKVRQIPGEKGCYNAHKISEGPEFTIYAPTQNQVLKSTNWGKTWDTSRLKMDPGSCIGSLAAGPKYIFASVFGNNTFRKLPVFRSTVQNMSWEKVSDVSEWLGGGDIPSVWPHPTKPDVVFMGGGSGLIVSQDAGITWKPFVQTGMPEDKSISDLLILPGSPMRLFGTFSNGVLNFTGKP